MKRLVSGLLWFVGVWCLYEVAVSITGLPRLAGPILGLGIATFVVIDPAGWFWTGSIVVRAPHTRSPRVIARAD